MTRLLYLWLCVLALALPTNAQQAKKSRQLRQLEHKRQSVLSKIKKTDQELKRVEQSTAQEQQRLKLVRQQVSQRREVIGILGQEISALQTQIDSLGLHIRVLGSQEARLLKQYVASLRALQHTEDPTVERLLFVLSARRLEEIYQRQKFLGQYARANQSIVHALRQTRQAIEYNRHTIDLNQQEKKQLLALRDSEKRQLEQEEGKRMAQVKTLQRQENKLSQQLERQRREAEQLDSQIQAQIAAEIAKAEHEARRQKARREARARLKRSKPRAEQPSSSHQPHEPSSSEVEVEEAPETERRAAIAGGYAMDAQERKLSGNFSKNRGRLPMPVRGRYDLVRRYGEQPHHSLSKVRIVNGGIDLRPLSDHHAYAVFSGVVSRIFETSGYGQSVIVRHGNYLTVYSNLGTVSVRSGQRIDTGQALGVISSSGGQKAGVLHFQLWHERTKQNPLPWLKK